jgi:SWI/SNF-related matrix-associated actin-dependent regulator of chromatin subfamily A protein 2/4
MKFNVMVTTYEFIMRDRAKLSKVEWKYMIIDEAQRMKDRESRLARDLDRFSCQRRLLLTGTPLQVLFSSEGTLFCVRNCVFLIVIYTPFPFTLA